MTEKELLAQVQVGTIKVAVLQNQDGFTIYEIILSDGQSFIINSDEMDNFRAIMNMLDVYIV